MLLHGLDYLLMGGIQFIQFPLRLLLLRRPVEGGKMVGGVRSLCYSFGEILYLATNQLPNPPIRIGITMKKIITTAWAVMMTL
jgi:hypothetical protein